MKDFVFQHKVSGNLPLTLAYAKVNFTLWLEVTEQNM